METIDANIIKFGQVNLIVFENVATKMIFPYQHIVLTCGNIFILDDFSYFEGMQIIRRTRSKNDLLVWPELDNMIPVGERDSNIPLPLCLEGVYLDGFATRYWTKYVRKDHWDPEYRFYRKSLFFHFCHWHATQFFFDLELESEKNQNMLGKALRTRFLHFRRVFRAAATFRFNFLEPKIGIFGIFSSGAT